MRLRTLVAAGGRRGGGAPLRRARPCRRDRRQRDARPDASRAWTRRRGSAPTGCGCGRCGRTSSRRRAVYTEHLVAELSHKAAALEARGIKVLVVIHRAPAWASGGRGGIAPPADPATFARVHAHARAARAGGRRLGALERAGRAAVLGGRARSRRLRGAAAGRLSRDQVGRARTTSSSPAARSATTSTSSGRCTTTARRARSTRSACTPTPPASSTARRRYYRDEQRPDRSLHVLRPTARCTR